MSYKRGDVILVKFPNSDLKTYKKRPALVVQDEAIDTGLSQKVVALITSNPSRTGITRVSVSKDSPAGKEMGILSDSMIVADNVAIVLTMAIDKVIGHCNLIIAEVDSALRKTFKL